jgi:hypothetical protein
MKVKRCKLVNCEECSHYKLEISEHSDKEFYGDEDWYCSWGEQLNSDFYGFIDDEINHEYLKNRPPCIHCQICDYYDKEKNICDTSVLEAENINWISREEEAELPTFESHEEAREFFKKKYGSRFQLNDSLELLECKIYIYNLITNMEKYMKSINDMQSGVGAEAIMEYHMSHQTIEIGEDGSIHILH